MRFKVVNMYVFPYFYLTVSKTGGTEELKKKEQRTFKELPRFE